MQVKLVAITQSLIKTGDGSRYLTPDEHIVYTARVSNPSNQLNTETAPRLLRYCIKNKHWSPFEQADLTFEVKTSRAIAAQMLRHKSASFQEFSQRYSIATEFEPVELRMQGKTNRQVGDDVSCDNQLRYTVDDALNACKKAYNHLIAKGVAKECARMVLPMTTQTTLFFKNNVRGWIHYMEQRCDSHAQKEHRLIALEIQRIFNENFPSIAEALKNE